jgi:hypothetical protein
MKFAVAFSVNLVERSVAGCIHVRGQTELRGHAVHTQYNVGDAKSV